MFSSKPNRIVKTKNTNREGIINPFKEQFTLVTQQEDIVLAAQDHDIIIVDSVAGSSKTCTQVVMAHNNPIASLYLTFSKELAVEAESMFPNNVECRTIHSLAYKFKGVDIAHKLFRPKGKYRNVAGTGSEIAKYYSIKSIDITDDLQIKNTLIGLMVKQTLAKYEASNDEVISREHLPYALIKTIENKHITTTKPVLSRAIKNLKQDVIKYANRLWKDRTDSLSPVLATHDTYVKMWALTNPTVDTNVLYLDEIQDASMVFIGVIQNQVGKCNIVLVGDPDQNLYSWRYSVNGLELVDGKKMELSQSFRYGGQIAKLAEMILGNGRSITGCTDISTQVGYENVVNKSKHYYKLFRLNSTLLQEAIILISEGKKVNIHVDVQDYVNMLESCQALYDGKVSKVKHEEIIPFDTWRELEDEAKSGGVLARLVNTVNKGNTYRVINLLRSHKNTDTPDVTLMTCHKSKGKTLDYVILAEDFPSNYNRNGEWVGIDDAEKRLLYVGVTRAKLGLEYNETVQELIDKYEAEQHVKEDRNFLELAADFADEVWFDPDNDEWMNRGTEEEEYNLRSKLESVGRLEDYRNGVTIIGKSNGEQAAYALQDVCTIEKLRDDFANHCLYDEDAFELGFIDPCGRTTDYANFKCDRILPFTNKDMEKDIIILEKYLDYNTTMFGRFQNGETCYTTDGSVRWKFSG